MSARQVQPADRAALIYVEDQLARQDRSAVWLSKKTGIPYRTLWRYMTKKDRALTVGDTVAILDALGIPIQRGIKDIYTIAATLNDGEDE